jgi:hypothetical protein
MADAMGVTAGMTISVRSRRDVVVVDPDRLLAAARRALQDVEPSLTDAQAAVGVADVVDAVFALLDRDGDLVPETMSAGDERATRRPRVRVTDRADGLSPAGWQRAVVLDDPLPLQDYGCFQPDDPFALRAHPDPTSAAESGLPAAGPSAPPDAGTDHPGRPAESAPLRTPEPVVAQLQAAALAAICFLTSPRADATDDHPNAHTANLTPYDLAGLFGCDPSAIHHDNITHDLDGLATMVESTSDDPERRRHRALWVAAELRRLGHTADAGRFARLAE